MNSFKNNLNKSFVFLLFVISFVENNVLNTGVVGKLNPYLFLGCLFACKWLIFRTQAKLSNNIRGFLYSIFIPLLLFLIEATPIVIIVLDNGVTQWISLIILILYAFLEDRFYKEINTQILNDYFRYFFFIGSMMLIVGFIDKELFTVVSILTTFVAFMMNDEFLDELFKTRFESLGKDEISLDSSYDKTTVIHLKVFLYLFVINLLIVTVLTDAKHLGPLIIERIRATFPIIADNNKPAVIRKGFEFLFLGGIRIGFTFVLIIFIRKLLEKGLHSISELLKKDFRLF
ncbi:hypothetical protein [Streptococcus sp. NLN64]|uniref:hypothetical protein n=1 Tax=Streptococcus sp. NLN64 TaxID=2822799 RepID=UPI0018CA2974|nr:hypothetical protein [Streptococcus sp. NLN64]MBG9367650.1 hypothetical protein [Streptococcus sp. NLN64]